MTGPAAFPADYATARTRFRAAADRLGWRLEAHPVSGTGPNGEELTIDAGISPHPTAERVLVVSSGLHGAEGPFGSAVQLAAMDRFAGSPPPAGVRYLFIHALNPWGYAHGRRTDADNVDPNRNFLLEGEAYSGSAPTYAFFDWLLNPRTPPRFDFWTLRAFLAVLRFGAPALRQALAGGQYDFPKGIFFGGHAPTATHLAMKQRLGGWIGPAADVVHLDYHTGLGKWAGYKLLLDSPIDEFQRDRLDRWFGPETHEEEHPTRTSYHQRGGFGPWCVAQQFAPRYLYTTAEFGTYGNIRMLGGLRAENRAAHWGMPGDRATDRARTALRELFVPPSPSWRSKVLAEGVELVMRGAAGLASSV